MRKIMFMKQIPIEALAVGMYIVALDRPWSEIVELGGKQRIECPEYIALLKQYGVQRVTIDPALSTRAAGSIKAENTALSAALPRSSQHSKHALSVGALERDLARAHTVRTEAMTAVQ